MLDKNNCNIHGLVDITELYFAENKDYLNSISYICIREEENLDFKLSVFICPTLFPKYFKEFKKHLNDLDYFYNLVKSLDFTYRDYFNKPRHLKSWYLVDNRENLINT